MDDENDAAPRRAGRPLWWRVVVRNPRDSLIAVVAAGATTAILVNGLFLQPGPHPAPIFAVKSPIAAGDQTGTVMMPRPRPPEADAVRRDAVVPPQQPPQPARSRSDIVTDIQRELVRRGFYDGAVDGVYGSRTDAALRDFEQASGVKTAGDVSEVTLQAILRAPAKSKTPLPAPAPRRDAIAELIAPPPPPAPTPSRQLIAVQRVLGDFGYGQVRPSGTFDAETRAAIERFERDRSMPITGQLSERLVRELGAMTGRPLD